MALSNLNGWNNEQETAPAACGSACGAGDKPAETPAACGAADKSSSDGTAEEKPAACGAGDK